MNSGKVLLGALAGIAAGAVLGILFAPDSGTSTRKKIVKKGNDYADGLGDQFNEFIGGMTKKFEALKEEAMTMAEETKAKAKDAIADVKAASDGKMNEVKRMG